MNKHGVPTHSVTGTAQRWIKELADKLGDFLQRSYFQCPQTTISSWLSWVEASSKLFLRSHLKAGLIPNSPFKLPQDQDVHMFDKQLCRKLPNGDPDFNDPQIFPVLWQESISE